MPLSRPAVVLSLALAIHSFGQSGTFTPLAVDPYDPTSADPVTLRKFYPTLANASGCTDAVSCAEHPAFASVADLTNGLPPGRAGVQIQGDAPLWAFATVTNNDTQHVTVVSPQ